MLHRTLFLGLSLLILVACGDAKAPTVVVVSVDRVAKESVRAKRIIREVEDYAKSVESQLNQMLQEIQAASTDPRMSSSDLGLMKDQWNQARQQAEEQVDLRRSKAEEEIHRMLEECLHTLAKEQGWDLVLRKDRHAALWASDKFDKTDLVIRRMDSAPIAAEPSPP